MRQGLPGTRRTRRPIRLHHEHQRPDGDRLAGEHPDPRPRFDPLLADARAVCAAQVFDLDVVPDVQAQVAAGGLGVVEVDVDAGAVPAADGHLAAGGQGEGRELLRPHHQQVEAVRGAGLARERRLVAQRARRYHAFIVSRVGGYPRWRYFRARALARVGPPGFTVMTLGDVALPLLAAIFSLESRAST